MEGTILTDLPIAAEVIVRSGEYAKVFEKLWRLVTRGGLPVHEQEEQPGVDELRTAKALHVRTNAGMDAIGFVCCKKNDCCGLLQLETHQNFRCVLS